MDGNGVGLADVVGTEIVEQVLDEHGALGDCAIWREVSIVCALVRDDGGVTHRLQWSTCRWTGARPWCW